MMAQQQRQLDDMQGSRAARVGGSAGHGSSSASSATRMAGKDIAAGGTKVVPRNELEQMKVTTWRCFV